METVTTGDKPHQYVVCCTKAMSQVAGRANALIMDTTFKLVLLFDTFVIATWDNGAQRCVVIARVFTNLLTEIAHAT